MLTDDELKTLAGKQAYSRGRTYHAEGRITLSRHDADGLEGEAEGTEDYALMLERRGADWQWDCTCPAADGGVFCKHLVAAVLTARDESDDAQDEAKEVAARLRKRASGEPLSTFLHAQPAERLADWLLTLAREDPAVDKRLRLYRAAHDPAELKTALGRMLDTGGMLDYRRSLAYARRLDEVAAQLDGSIATDAAAGRTLCEYVLGRLLKIYVRSDDSAGAIGDRLHRIAGLHARACNASPPGKALVKPLLALQAQDEWRLFDVSGYWDALGTDGQADYGTRVVAEFERLPQKPAAGERWGAAFAVLRRVEAYARASGDFTLLQRVLRRDLKRPHDYMRVLESLRESGRDREALAWAEQAVKAFPRDDGLRLALAGCLHAAGLTEDAVAQTWQAFQQQYDTQNWDALKRMAGTHWPSWRERALAHVAAQEQHGEATLRVLLLDHDCDVDAAVALANRHPVRADLLQRLAKRLERSAPDVAGAFYIRIAGLQVQHLDTPRYRDLVDTLKRIARCVPAEQWKPLLTTIRAEHARKRKLMQMLDAAKL